MLNISIVLYQPKWEEEVNPLVEELKKVKCLRHLYLRDNTNDNIGYGRAHNIELRKSAYEQTEFHLVMNSDIRVKAEDIDAMHEPTRSYSRYPVLPSRSVMEQHLPVPHWSASRLALRKKRRQRCMWMLSEDCPCSCRSQSCC